MNNFTKEKARGKWLGILTHFGVDEGCLRNVHGPCPVCGGKDRFRFDDKDGKGTFFCTQCRAGDGFDLLMKLKGWDFATAAKNVDEIVGGVVAKAAPKKRDPRPALREMRDKLKPIGGDVSSYLLNRGVPIHHAGLLRQAEHRYFDKDSQKVLGSFPCMVGEIKTPSGKIASYHITYLKDGKKAPVPSPKKVMTPAVKITGGAIRLTEVHGHIGIAEGIETALMVMSRFHVPCWAAISATLLEAFEPPEGVDAVTIYGDNDINFTGQKSAYVLANKLSLKGYSVTVCLPEKTGMDFADLAHV